MYRYPIGVEDYDVIVDNYRYVYNALSDYGNVIGIPTYASLEYLTKDELSSIRDYIDSYIAYLERGD